MAFGSRIVGGVAALALFLALMGLRPAVAQENGELRIGTVGGNKPWAFRDERGQLVGFDIELTDQIARGLGLRARPQEMGFRELFTALATGRIDLAAASITIVSDRVGRYDFTQPYYDTGQGVLVLKKGGIRKVDDLADKVVSVTSGTTNETWLVANAQRYGISRTTFSTSATQAAEELETGRIDAYIGDLPALAYQQLKNPNLTVIGRLSTDERYGLALPKNSPLTAQVDAVLSRLKQDGTLARIHKRWFGMAPDKTSATVTVLPRP